MNDSQDTPRINNELIVRQKISRPMVNARKKLILGILEQSGKPDLGFDVKATTPDVALYRTVLVQTGLYRMQDTGWNWAVHPSRNQRARPSGTLAEASGLFCYA